jgi:hypothetical protein
VHFVAHLVRLKSSFDLGNHFFSRWDLSKRKRPGGSFQAIEVFVQFEDAALIQAQSLPYRIPALHCRIKRADAGVIAMNQATVYVNDQIPVPFIEFLQHLTADQSTAKHAKQR